MDGHIDLTIIYILKNPWALCVTLVCFFALYKLNACKTILAIILSRFLIFGSLLSVVEMHGRKEVAAQCRLDKDL